MYRIYKISSNPVVDFAAEELKKYLRMMMPRCGEITIAYEPTARIGFRLGLMSDFGLSTDEAEDVTLDDILHMETDKEGGVIAGSNPRSVLLAVYRYLTINGCRWLFPGVDGEYIPIKEIDPVNYHKMADCRYRGQCNEGAEFQQNMLETIDFTPKVGLNIFMLEFDNPKAYYDMYYQHMNNKKNRVPEPVNKETTLQWKRACEAEIAKRGLEFHDVGHGWTAEPFGIDSSDGWKERDESIIPADSRQYLAQVNGRRGFFKGSPLVTQFCMSNPEARAKVVQAVANYCALNTNVDYLHVWLADFYNNHCECETCRTMIPTDWYMMLLNEIDEELTRRNLNNRITFACYTETLWPAEKVKLKNPKRFTMMLAPITRAYYKAITPRELELSWIPFVHNDITFPKDGDEYIMFGNKARKQYQVRSFLYEYHFCPHQYYNPGNMKYARMIYDDVRAYKANGYEGIVQDGTQRNYFPNGFLFYVYAETLFDTSVKFEHLVEDYYSHAYGEDWRQVVRFMEELGEVVPQKYLAGKEYAKDREHRLYNPAMTERLRSLPAKVESFEPFVEAHKNMPKRVQTVAMRLLGRYLEFWKGIAEPLALKSESEAEEAGVPEFFAFMEKYGAYEIEMERYYDHRSMLGSAYHDNYFYKVEGNIPDV